jgi:hypothetical protein
MRATYGFAYQVSRQISQMLRFCMFKQMTDFSKEVDYIYKIYCYMLGFLGNMTCCVTMGLLRFLSNATVPVA